MRVRREQPHHGQRVDGEARRAIPAVGQQLRTFLIGGEWFGHGSESPATRMMRSHASIPNTQTQTIVKRVRKSTNAPCIETAQA
ncbi:hypothetical protein GCM10007935_05600 [Hydrogenophaga electricum]|uniref:Uncharacterized protein n=1 Tax=Hydrogenophaga electricum TaxID=1230953 RepID=A0ABQ6C471_9BURK|nr:hypothetical protein GCM10007935_05600 [Hydrogenophaga electricum]